MQYLRSLMMVLVVASMVFSCSKDEETPTYKKEDFVAHWLLESREGDKFNECSTQKDELKVAPDKLTITSYSSDCTSISYEIDYTFDGKNKLSADAMGIKVTMTILELTSSKLKVKTVYEGMGTSITETYSRKI